jgi:nickel-dependent lactate racemase
MISTLRYGCDSSLRLELASEAVVAHCAAPRGQPLVQVAQAVDRALAEPLEFPALVQAALPGDKVVLALADAVPQAATIVARTVEVLLAAGVAASDITLLRTMSEVETAPDPLGELRPDVGRHIVSQTHDPANRQALGYLAASAEGEPIYINRAIHDADLVISIGCLRVDESLGYYGVHSGVFPTFSDKLSVERYRSPKSSEPRHHQRLRAAADEVGWLLGLHFTIQVVPGAGTDVLHVLAGELDAVVREGCRRCDEAWSYSVPDRASLVVATIEGGAAQQTWDNVARALAAASHAVREDGAVAICCELDQRPGPALKCVVGADDLDAALRDIARHKPEDALAAAELVRALKRGKVYLLSRLDEELVEDLGIMPVAADQVSRLAARYDSCIVLTNAQYAQARPSGETRDQRPLAQPKSRP